MKKLLSAAFLTLLLSFPLQGTGPSSRDYDTRDEQYKLVKKLMRSHGIDLRWDGHVDIESSGPYIMTLKWLNEYYHENDLYETPLSPKDYRSLYSCYHGKHCALWFYEISSSYMSGTGIWGAFVLFYLNLNHYQIISHGQYAE